MTTINAVNVGLSGATGTGNFVGANTPTLITPVLGAATATSLAFSPTTGGIIGTTAADNASAGDVGQFISSTIALASAVSLTSPNVSDVTSISLTAGDWDVFGNISFNIGGACTVTSCWLSLTSATEPDYSLRTGNSGTAIGSFATATNPLRVNVSTTTTVYISAVATFSTSTVTACGGIFARRRR